MSDKNSSALQAVELLIAKVESIAPDALAAMVAAERFQAQAVIIIFLLFTAAAGLIYGHARRNLKRIVEAPLGPTCVDKHEAETHLGFSTVMLVIVVAVAAGAVMINLPGAIHPEGVVLKSLLNIR